MCTLHFMGTCFINKPAGLYNHKNKRYCPTIQFRRDKKTINTKNKKRNKRVKNIKIVYRFTLFFFFLFAPGVLKPSRVFRDNGFIIIVLRLCHPSSRHGTRRGCIWRPNRGSIEIVTTRVSLSNSINSFY